MNLRDLDTLAHSLRDEQRDRLPIREALVLALSPDRVPDAWQVEPSRRSTL